MNFDLSTELRAWETIHKQVDAVPRSVIKQDIIPGLVGIYDYFHPNALHQVLRLFDERVTRVLSREYKSRLMDIVAKEFKR